MIPSRLSNAETRELATSVVTDGVKQHRLDSGGNHVLDRGTATPVFINGHSICPLSKPGRGYSLVAGRSIVLMQAAGTLSGQPRFRVAVVWVEWRLFSGQTGQASYHGRKLADAAIVIRDPSPRVEPMAKCRTLEPAPIMKDSLVRLTHCPSSRSFRRLVRRS